MKAFNELRGEWLEEEKKRRSNTDGKRAKRRYLHFDNRLNLSDIKKSNVWMPNVIIGHSFFPFIRYTIKTRRLRKTQGSKKQIIEKKRDIDYAAHGDALIYSWYAFLLTEYYENFIKTEGVDSYITAYRKNLGENNVNFAKRVFDFISEKENCSVLCLDVEHFFPSLDHQLLKKNWMLILGVDSLPKDHYVIFRIITRFSYVLMDLIIEKMGRRNQKDLSRLCTPIEFRNKISPLIIVNRAKKGIPQGSPISAVLSNIYMLQFDIAVSNQIEAVGGLYQRYCDDIIIVVPTKYIAKIESFTLSEIAKIQLTINPSKMEKREFKRIKGKLRCFDSGSDNLLTLKYLGLEFDGERSYIRHSGIGKYEKRMNRSIKKAAELNSAKKRSAFPKKKIYEKFSHSNKSNFISYSIRAGEILRSAQIKKQFSKYRIIKKIKKSRNKASSTK
ncbi:MAG: hypothetical protein HGB18_01330 [Candidatus Moranbacteria bacterium]|nr:hypothetical protein [Candidatus Moranbacteria bacterium]